MHFHHIREFSIYAISGVRVDSIPSRGQSTETVSRRRFKLHDRRDTSIMRGTSIFTRVVYEVQTSMASFYFEQHKKTSIVTVNPPCQAAPSSPARRKSLHSTQTTSWAVSQPSDGVSQHRRHQSNLSGCSSFFRKTNVSASHLNHFVSRLPTRRSITALTMGSG